jgi:hypothetical protein
VNRKPKHISLRRRRPERKDYLFQDGRIESRKMLLDGRTTNESIVLLRPGNGTGLVIGIEIARELPVREADLELQQEGVAAVSRDLQVLSTSIGTYLVRLEVEAVVGKAPPLEVQRASETGVAAEIRVEIEIRTETLDVLGMTRNLVVGVGLEAAVGGGIGIGIGIGIGTGIGRRLGAEVAVHM